MSEVSTSGAPAAQPPALAQRVRWGIIGRAATVALWIALAVSLHFNVSLGSESDLPFYGLALAALTSAVWLGVRGSPEAFVQVAATVLIAVGAMTVASGAADRAAVEPCPSGMDYIGRRGPCPTSLLEQSLAGVFYVVPLLALTLPGLVVRGACAIRRRSVSLRAADR